MRYCPVALPQSHTKNKKKERKTSPLEIKKPLDSLTIALDTEAAIKAFVVLLCVVNLVCSVSY